VNRKKQTLALLGAGVLISSLAACGSDEGDGGTGGAASGAPWILGTTDSITSMDPAGAYDFGSWNMQYSIFQQLMVVPANATQPVDDAAHCAYTDPKTVSCTLKSGLTFTNGHALTSSDVKFSFERNIAIADPDGASLLFGQLFDTTAKKQTMRADAIETPDDTTVVFHLNAPDVTFLQYLTTAAASIVDEEVYPADKLLADDQAVGSGPYILSQYKPTEQAVLEANPDYEGDRASKSSKIFVQFFSDPAPLKQAIETKQIDVAWRTLSPTDLEDLATKDGVEVIKGGGSEFRYWTFQLANDAVKDPAVRQAVAQLIDRDAIAKDAYDGTVTPAYSIVPTGYDGHKDSFQEKYGEPSVDKAKALLDAAGIKTPVSLTLGYTPEHYGPNAVDEATELADQLESSGLFKIKTESAEWEEYQDLEKEGAYDLFLYGWYPDIRDTDNYLTPFLVKPNFFVNNYDNPAAVELLAKETSTDDQGVRNEAFGQLQDIVAEDVPLIPSWTGQNVAVATDQMDGVKSTLDPTYIFRYWMVSKK
jgi:peptide/nickel transport system substrate-binding protein